MLNDGALDIESTYVPPKSSKKAKAKKTKKVTETHKLELTEHNGNYPLKSIHMICGKRNSGKTCTVKHEIYAANYDEYDDVFILNGTEAMHSNYADMSDHVYVFADEFAHIIDKALTIPNKKYFIVLDNWYSNRIFISWVSELILRISSLPNQITLVMCVQFPISIKPEVRARIDYVHLLHDDTISTTKKLYNHYFGLFPSFSSFREVYTQVTSKQYYRLMVDNMTKSYDFLDKVKWKKTDITVPISKNCTSDDVKNILKEFCADKAKTDLENVLKDVNESINKLIDIRNNIKLIINKN